MASDPLTLDRLAPAVGDAFALDAEGAPPVELVLCEAQPFGTPADGDGRQPFTLTFSGPAEPLLAQQIVPLVHPELGRLEIFLVPLAPAADGARYEAVFA